MAIPDPGPLQRYLSPGSSQAWIRRGEGLIGIGEAARFTCRDIDAANAWWSGFAAALELETELPGAFGTGPLAFGSFVFDPGHSALASVLVVPETIIGRRGGQSWLTRLSTVVDDYTGLDSPAEAELAAVGLAEASAEPVAPVGVEFDAGEVSGPDWADMVGRALARIDAGEVSKVVLARSVCATAAQPIDPRWVVRELARDYPTCWTYLVDGLVGASPEMLIRREGGLATSRVLAGTIRRNGSEQADLLLAASLSQSGKNLIEHELAVESVARALAPFCSGMNVPDAPYVLQLPNVLHLASDVTGVCSREVSALTLAARLHPSAAVCGTPTNTARELIRELESMDRGRYAGPVGWIDANGDGEWAIALRCGWRDPDNPNKMHLYAGCGIVAESDPQAELAETRAKLVPMRDALGG